MGDGESLTSPRQSEEISQKGKGKGKGPPPVPKGAAGPDTEVVKGKGKAGSPPSVDPDPSALFAAINERRTEAEGDPPLEQPNNATGGGKAKGKGPPAAEGKGKKAAP